MRQNPLPQTGATTRGVLFDLDGTLVDSAPDLALALNLLRAEMGLRPLPFAQIRPEVSNGGTALIRLGFRRGPDDAEFEPLRRRFLELYQQNLTTHTRLFPGMEELLESLEQEGIRWGVVTNKPGWLTDPLLEQLDLARRAACVVSGDTLAQCKPHPAPLLYASHRIGCSPAECIYLGDARRDIEAGRSAGMRTLVALFGYIGEEEDPRRWKADGMIRQPQQALEWL